MMRSHYFLPAAILLGSLAIAQQPEEAGPEFSFAVIADVQYADKNPVGARHYRSSLTRLKQCVTELNQHDLEFVVQLGDFIDAGKDSFDAVLPIWKTLKAPRREKIM